MDQRRNVVVFKVVDMWQLGGNDAIVEAVKNYEPIRRRSIAPEGPEGLLIAENSTSEGD